VIRCEADDDERVDTVSTQIVLETRSDESTIHFLAIDGLGVSGRCSRLNRIAGRIWAQKTLRLYRIVDNVPDRSPAVSPSSE